jgi:hypothetical protein
LLAPGLVVGEFRGFLGFPEIEGTGLVARRVVQKGLADQLLRVLPSGRDFSVIMRVLQVGSRLSSGGSDVVAGSGTGEHLYWPLLRELDD